MSIARIAGVVGAVAVLMSMSIGCETLRTAKTTDTEAPLFALCNKCGEVKGTDACCKLGVAKCAKCGLTKGAPGCCKIPKGTLAPLALCTKCGEIKGTDACCKPNVAKCGKCGMTKGAPGCCKLAQVKK